MKPKRKTRKDILNTKRQICINRSKHEFYKSMLRFVENYKENLIKHYKSLKEQ